MWGQKHKAIELALSLRSTQLIYNVWEIEIHNRKINEMVEGKDKKSRLFIYKNCSPKGQRGVLKDEYK